MHHYSFPKEVSHLNGYTGILYHVCKCLWVPQLFECSGAKLYIASYMIHLKIPGWAVWVPKQQYCSQSIPQCTQTISFWVSNAALWKSMQLLEQQNLIVLPVPQLPGFALFLPWTLPKLLVFLYITTGWVGVFFLFFANASSWKTGSNSKYLRFLAKFPLTWFHLLHSVKLFTCGVPRIWFSGLLVRS